ncbi:hypothetical protein HY485_01795, partial [Candidatus Woesearchaeota archaeon]|nr:hypothetical protein [Candidatus Woesearchaeota archaeon]
MMHKRSFFILIIAMVMLLGLTSCLRKSVTVNTLKCVNDASKNLSVNDCDHQNIREEAFKERDKIKEIVPVID